MATTLIAGRYRLEERIGRGGMSEVWAATDLELGRRVALKLLATHADTERFVREARAVASLGHPNITQVYDYGQADGRPYMVLEHLSGGTLEERLRTGKPLPDAETAGIAAEIAAGLAHAHDRGVVHRDLKPANVLFDGEGRAKLADFGIARLVAGDGTLTEAGTVLGTAAYISPEQASGEPASAASDVYSFGAILYRMLTGRLPFEATSAMELVTLHRDAPVPPLAEIRPDAPARLESTATAALEKDPAHRPADGQALLAALGVPTGAGYTTTLAPVDGDATRVLPVVHGPAPGAPRPPRRLPLVLAALGALGLAGAGLAYELTRPAGGPTDVPTLSVTTPTTARQTHSTLAATTTAASTPSTTTQAPPTTTRAPAPLPPPPPTVPTTTTAPTDTAPTTTTTPTDTTAPPTTTAPPPTDTAAPTVTTGP